MTTQKKDKGFTLVELLIVIVILGILATVTVFAVRGITNQGKETACRADRKTIQTAVEAYAAQGGLLPNLDGAAGLDQIVDAGLLADGSLSSNWTYDYTAADATATPPVAESYTLTAAGDCVGVTL